MARTEPVPFNAVRFGAGRLSFEANLCHHQVSRRLRFEARAGSVCYVKARRKCWNPGFSSYFSIVARASQDDLSFFGWANLTVYRWFLRIFARLFREIVGFTCDAASRGLRRLESDKTHELCQRHGRPPLSWPDKLLLLPYIPLTQQIDPWVPKSEVTLTYHIELWTW